MKKLLFLIVGVVIGFFVAHKVNETSKGREFFETIDKKARDFGQVVSQGYQEREAEIRSNLDAQKDEQ